MAAKGICWTKTAESGAEYARVNYGTGARLDTVPRARYEQAGYQPPFEQLPICDVPERS